MDKTYNNLEVHLEEIEEKLLKVDKYLQLNSSVNDFITQEKESDCENWGSDRCSCEECGFTLIVPPGVDELTCTYCNFVNKRFF